MEAMVEVSFKGLRENKGRKISIITRVADSSGNGCEAVESVVELIRRHGWRGSERSGRNGRLLRV